MRVLHLAPGASRPGGIATYATRFATSLRSAGVMVQPRDVSEAGVGSTRGFDLVHVELGGPCREEFWAARELARRGDVPFVATLHDPPRCVWRPYEAPALARSRVVAAAASTLVAPRARRAETFVARAAAGLLVMSETALPAVRRTLGLRPTARLRTMPHPRRCPPGPRAARPPRSPLVAGFHGYWFGGKGIEVLVDAVALTRADAEPVRARLWGEPAPDSPAAERYRHAVLRRIRDRSVEALVSVEGPIPGLDLSATLREAHVIVVPHRTDPITYRGLQPVSGALEDALGAGVPVIAADVRAFAEQVREGVDGLLVPPEDPQALAAMLRRLRDDDRLLGRLWAGAATPRPDPEPGEIARALYEDVLGV